MDKGYIYIYIYLQTINKRNCRPVLSIDDIGLSNNVMLKMEGVFAKKSCLS